MGVLKAKVDSTWVEVGSGVGGVPAGGTTGQVLSKTSAADYATAWSGVILSNNVPLAGKRVDGSLQGLIGDPAMSSAEDYLRQDVGAIIASLLFQLAMTKAELDRLKAEVEAPRGHTNERVPAP